MTNLDSRMILVFQVAKVASRSWWQLLNATFPKRAVVHFHFISTNAVERAEQTVAATQPTQTIKHMSLGRLGRPPELIKPFITDGVWTGPPVDIVAGMRDPVARAVSAVAFLCNHLGYTQYGVTVRDGGTAESLSRLFFTALRHAQAGSRSNDTMVDLLSNVMFDYRRWFDEELNAGFGLDVFSTPFDHTQSALCLSDQHRVLVYRVEDLKKPTRHKRLIATASDYFDQPLQSVPPEVMAGQARFQEFYKAFLGTFFLSKDDLDWFYDHPTVTHFYTPEETAGFRQRWAK